LTQFILSQIRTMDTNASTLGFSPKSILDWTILQTTLLDCMSTCQNLTSVPLLVLWQWVFFSEKCIFIKLKSSIKSVRENRYARVLSTIFYCASASLLFVLLTHQNQVNIQLSLCIEEDYAYTKIISNPYTLANYSW
jgi:hypothetical protein